MMVGGLAAACSVAVLVAPAIAAKPHVKYISGRLRAPGYTLAVVGYNGKAVFARGSSFRVVAPAAKVTLQLINSKGVYAGPVVFGGSASRVIVGVKAGTNLGVITLDRGYGRTAKLAAKSLDKTRWAYARHGVPLGNGLNLGLVVSKTVGHGGGAGADPAHIGIPNEFNIALPGTHVLKSLAPATKAAKSTKLTHGARAVIAAVCPPPPAVAPPGCTPPPPPTGSSGGTGASGPTGSTGPGAPGGGNPAPGAAPPAPNISPWMSQLALDMSSTVNADAAGVTQAQIDATLQANLNLKLLNIPAGSLVELNCNGLSFCSQGGTGKAQLEGIQPGAIQPGVANTVAAGGYGTVPFPAGSLDSASGLGEIVGPAVPAGLLGTDANGGHEFSLNPNATTAQIGSGDVISEIVTDSNGVSTQTPTTLDFVFTTVPAITAYSDSAGDAGTISYPDTSGLGTQSNPLKIKAGANGDVVATFTVVRPQRPGVAGAGESTLMDIGHLGYELDYATAPTPGSTTVGSTLSPQCPTSSYSNPSSTLTASAGTSGGFGPPPGSDWLVDSAADAPANPANTMSFSIDLTQCLASKGVTSFPVGQPVTFDLSANSQSSLDHANQTFVVERTS
jgi:hypothetical protein